MSLRKVLKWNRNTIKRHLTKQFNKTKTNSYNNNNYTVTVAKDLPHWYRWCSVDGYQWCSECFKLPYRAILCTSHANWQSFQSGCFLYITYNTENSATYLVNDLIYTLCEVSGSFQIVSGCLEYINWPADSGLTAQIVQVQTQHHSPGQQNWALVIYFNGCLTPPYSLQCHTEDLIL